MMRWLKSQLRTSRQSFKNDSLFRNAVYLIASTGIMSVLGFGFWIFVAHLYSPDQIGAAAALISITLLISNLSLFGLNSGVLRFLPASKSRSRDINAAMVVVGLASIVAAAIYVLWVGHTATGTLRYFFSNPIGQLLFLLLAAAVSLNTFTDSIFIASRRAEFHTIVYANFGLVKLILPILFIGSGSLGIFIAYATAAVISLLLSLVLMARYCDYQPFSRPNWRFLTDSSRYASNNYLASLLNGLPGQLMPTLIIERIGNAEAAYFSMAWTMANLLYVVPSAINNSLLAESTNDVTHRSHHLQRAIKILATILIPAVIGAILVAPFVIRLFGSAYAKGGTVVFQILAATTFFIAVNAIGGTVLNLRHKSGSVMIIQGIITAATLLIAWPFLRFGLVGVGLAMLIGNVIGNLCQYALFARLKRQSQSHTAVSGGAFATKQQTR